MIWPVRSSATPLQLCACTPGVSCTALNTDLHDERSMLTRSFAAHCFRRMGPPDHVGPRHTFAIRRVGEQGEHLKSSLAAVARLQHTDNQAQRHAFNSQVDSLLQSYQALLAQVHALYC